MRRLNATGLLLLAVASAAARHSALPLPRRAVQDERCPARASARVVEQDRACVALRLRGGEMLLQTTMLLAGDSAITAKSVLAAIVRILTMPFWFFDKIDKEAFVLSIPIGLRRQILRIMFYPTLLWTMLLHRMMPDVRRWYDRIDSRVIIGALPLKRQLDTLARIEGVTGVINCCDEFGGHAEEYSRYRMRELRLPTMDYCSPTAQQIENGLDFIRKQPPGGTVYVHCKAGRGRAGTMTMAYLMSSRGMTPLEAQRTLTAARPHVSPSLWKRPTVREMHRRNQQRLLMQQMQIDAQAAQAQAQAPQGQAAGMSAPPETAPSE